MKFEGVFVANVTPFTRSFEVDWEALNGHYEFLLQNGVQGLVPCGTTGESPTVSSEERIKVIEMAVQKAKEHGNTQVIAGCGSNNTLHSLHMIESAAKAGADAALVVTPYYNKPTQAGLLAHYQYLADRTPLPIILYNVPGRTSVNINAETAAEMFQHSKIVGIKEASGNHSQWMQLSSLVDFSKKSFLAGDDDAFATVYDLGGCGIISGTANVVPKHFVKLYEFLKAKKDSEALAMQKKLLPLVQAIFAETNPGPCKFALSAMKCMENSLRLPLVPVSKTTEQKVLAALKGLELL